MTNYLLPGEDLAAFARRTYDASIHFDSEPDGYGGVRLIPKGAAARTVHRLGFRDGIGVGEQIAEHNKSLLMPRKKSRSARNNVNSTRMTLRLAAS